MSDGGSVAKLRSTPVRGCAEAEPGRVQRLARKIRDRGGIRRGRAAAGLRRR